MSEVKYFLVGGAVRDKLLGIENPKDLDYACEADSYETMRQSIIDRGGTIFLETQKFLTIRAKVPGLGASDFVLCRKDSQSYGDWRRPDFVEPGTLLDDLARRDLTINAMAEDEEGNLIDPFGGLYDVRDKILRCVGDTETRMKEDALRIARVIRFFITKGFGFSADLYSFLTKPENAALLYSVSIERIMEELKKCFEFNTVLTLHTLNSLPDIRDVIFSRNIKLVPTIVPV